MKAIGLEQVVPRTGTFTIPRGEEIRTYSLRPFNLLDETWLKHTFGERAQEVFEKGTVEEMARIAFHQLVPEDQDAFAKQTVKIVDEEGNSESMELGGYKLLQAQIIGPVAKRNLILAIWETIGVSRPIIEIMRTGQKAEAGDKKKAIQTGDSSSTSSRQSTAGRPRKSSSSRRAR